MLPAIERRSCGNRPRRGRDENPQSHTPEHSAAWKLIMQRLWHRAFQVGIVLKGFDGALQLEVAGGTALLLATQRAVALLIHEDLIEDPHDFLANLLVQTVQHLSIGTQHFAGVYLVGHGIIKIGLAIGLLRGLLWSYPLALLFLNAFIIYQLYRLVHTHSITLSLFTAFDFAIVLLIWREWQHAQNVEAPSDLSPQISKRAYELYEQGGHQDGHVRTGDRRRRRFRRCSS